MALQMERRLAGENVFAGFFFCGERQRLKDSEGKIKEKDRGLYDPICVSVLKTDI